MIKLHKRSFLIVRSVILLLLLLAAVNPPAPWGRMPLDVFLLLDDSASMPSGKTDEAWRVLTQAVRQAPDGSSFGLIRFAEDAVEEIPLQAIRNNAIETKLTSPVIPRQHPLSDSSTDMESAIRLSLSRMESDRNPVLILVTDGRETSGNARSALQLAADHHIPMLWWKTTDSVHPSGSWIEYLSLPPSAVINEPTTLQASIGTAAPVEALIELRADGRKLEERPVVLHPDEKQELSFNLEFKSRGFHQIEVRLITPGDQTTGNVAAFATLRVDGPTRILYLADRKTGPVIKEGLRLGNWMLEETQPARFQPGELARFDLLIIDDLEAWALPEAHWQGIGEAVEQQGLGLMVLGGVHSFGGGGYRHSLLEKLLPVTAEALMPQPSVAVMFLLDKSGSMSRTQPSHSGTRMDAARYGILETIKALGPGDLSGLMAFDVDPRVILPLDFREDPVLDFRNNWEFASHGGTRLMPALVEALKRLSAAPVPQRLLILVTDGFVEERIPLEQISESIQEAGIDLIAMAIGSQDTGTVLRQLTALNDGQLLIIEDLARLPGLMQSTFAGRRPTVKPGPVRPRPPGNLPFLDPPPDTWPDLSAVMQTKIRPGAGLNLASEKGDPLIASHFYGSGRVTVLPGGLDHWAADWHRWDNWNGLVGGLISWTAAGYLDPRVQISHSKRSNRLEVHVDLVEAPLNWSTVEPPRFSVLSPTGDRRNLTTEPVAPGRFRLIIPDPAIGQYTLSLHWDGPPIRYTANYQGFGEFKPNELAPSPLEAALEMGTLQRWRGPGFPWDIPDSHPVESRQLLLALALAAYLVMLVLERDLIRGNWRRRSR